MDAQSAGLITSGTCRHLSGGNCDHLCDTITHEGLEAPRVATNLNQDLCAICPGVYIAQRDLKHVSAVTYEPGYDYRATHS